MPEDQDNSIGFDVRVGLPFGRRIRIVNGISIWESLDDFEARMHIRVTKDSKSRLKYDFTSHLIKEYDENDIIIWWELTGEQTRDLKFGYFDLILSDVGLVDVRAIRIIYGYLKLLPITTTAGELP